MLKIAVHGATGRTGKHVVEIIQQDPTLVLSGCYSQNTIICLDTFCQNNDIIIDFSQASATKKLLAAASNSKVALVIGTTGLDEFTHQLIAKTAAHIPILYSANMSYGITILNKLLSLACRFLPSTEYDVSIIDKHHKFKKDSPSGTALMLDETIKQAWSDSKTKPSIQQKDNIFGRIQHASIKLGNIVGEHQVCFANLDEQITISHLAETRNVFALGAIRAARWLVGKPPGLYSMTDVI